MPSSTGVNARSGQPLSDWDHVQQSIRKILTTPIGTRVRRRHLGSEVPDFVDAKMTQRNILLLYSAAATAIERQEPRYRVSAGRIETLNVQGQIAIELFGTYFPRGHEGDYSIAETASTRVIFRR